MFVAASKSAVLSRDAPAGSVASARTHKTVRSHTSSRLKEHHSTTSRLEGEAASRAPTVIPADSISQAPERTAEVHSTTPSRATHASNNHLPASSHHSKASYNPSGPGSQLLTEANLEVHNDGSRSGAKSVVPEAVVVEDRATKSSHHSGGGSGTHDTSHKSSTVHSTSATSSHKSTTAVPSKAITVKPSRAGSKAPTAIPSHARSDSASATPSHAHSKAPTSSPAAHVHSPPSKPPTIAPSKAASIAPSKTASKAPTSASSKDSEPASPETPSSPISPKAPTAINEATAPEASSNLELARPSSDTSMSSKTTMMHLIEVERSDEQFVRSEYKIQRRHVYPIEKPPLLAVEVV